MFVVIDRKHNDESLQKQCIKEEGRQEAGLEAAGLPVRAAIRSLAGVTLSLWGTERTVPQGLSLRSDHRLNRSQ